MVFECPSATNEERRDGREREHRVEQRAGGGNVDLFRAHLLKGRLLPHGQERRVQSAARSRHEGEHLGVAVGV